VVGGLVASAGEVPLVVVVRDDAVHPWQRAVVEACIEARPTVVVELGWPSTRRWGAAATIVTHGAARSSAAAVIDLLGGTA
jgi:beta-N-acetylhexosaminidase